MSVVGIVGGGERPENGEQGGFKGKLPPEVKNSGLKSLIGKIRQLVKEHGDKEVGQREIGGKSAPQIYGSTDGTPIRGSATFKSKTAQEIADEQFKLIQDTVGDGSGLANDEVYRLLLVGHSWGADKAVEVANLLGEMLANDPVLGPLYMQGRDKIQIHLVTLDAIEQGTDKASTRKLEKAKGVHVASWLNLNQTTDTGFGVLPKLSGSGPNDFDDDHYDVVRVNLDQVPFVTGNGHHARMPMVVEKQVGEHLYPEKP